MTVGDCALCGMNAKLVKSHIIPEWAYRPLFDQKHRILKIKSDNPSPVGFVPTGEWDRFLCHECEASFQKLDEYGRAIIFSEPGQPTFGIGTGPTEYGVDIYPVDYKRIKLFQISVLWRASVCKREFFKDINLGEHEPTIRDMLINGNAGASDDYGCVLSAVRTQPDMLLFNIDQPDMYEEKGWKIARFLFAGCIWLYIIRQGAKCFPLSSYFAQPESPLPILINELENIKGLASDLQWLENIVSNRDKS